MREGKCPHCGMMKRREERAREMPERMRHMMAGRRADQLREKAELLHRKAGELEEADVPDLAARLRERAEQLEREADEIAERAGRVEAKREPRRMPGMPGMMQGMAERHHQHTRMLEELREGQEHLQHRLDKFAEMAKKAAEKKHMPPEAPKTMGHMRETAKRHGEALKRLMHGQEKLGARLEELTGIVRQMRDEVRKLRHHIGEKKK
ncbi:MAG: hypothetical protein ACOC7T_01395 [Planctomycetota bacterium]